MKLGMMGTGNVLIVDLKMPLILIPVNVVDLKLKEDKEILIVLNVEN